MATFNKFEAFVEKQAEKVFNLGTDNLAVALTNSVPLATYSQLSQISEISYTNLSSRAITITSSAQVSGVYRLILSDLTLTASGSVGPFRYVVIYDDTASNDDLICWYDYGSSITMASGETFVIDFDLVNGLFSVT